MHGFYYVQVEGCRIQEACLPRYCKLLISAWTAVVLLGDRLAILKLSPCQFFSRAFNDKIYRSPVNPHTTLLYNKSIKAEICISLEGPYVRSSSRVIGAAIHSILGP